MEKTIYAKEYRALLRWLRDARNERGLSLRELGDRLDVHHSQIGRIETGERRLDLFEFTQLCFEIGCDPHEGLELMAGSLRGRSLPTAEEERAAYRAEKHCGKKSG